MENIPDVSAHCRQNTRERTSTCFAIHAKLDDWVTAASPRVILHLKHWTTGGGEGCSHRVMLAKEMASCSCHSSRELRRDVPYEKALYVHISFWHWILYFLAYLCCSLHRFCQLLKGDTHRREYSAFKSVGGVSLRAERLARSEVLT